MVSDGKSYPAGLNRRQAVVSAAAATVVLSGRSPTSSFPDAEMAPVIRTTTGFVRGYNDAGVAAFKGIPYGASTGGPGRFHPPSRPAGWRGVRNAQRWGFSAPQDLLGGLTMADLTPVQRVVEETYASAKPEPLQSEDCLCLNVWSRSPTRGPRRPVMVWLHGGGFFAGSASIPLYDGRNLAQNGDVIVVSINHRLNVFGYLFLEEVEPDFKNSANLGQCDIVLALQWVNENIANFGGDPGNVTIFGQSGGGAKCIALLGMPEAKGLFHKAIIQSGAPLDYLSRAAAIDIAQQVRDLLGRPTHTARELVDASVAALVKAGLGHTYLPVIDGAILPVAPFTPSPPDISSDIPILIGTNHDETTSMVSAPKLSLMTNKDLEHRADQIDSTVGRALLAHYRALWPGRSPGEIYVALTTDTRFWSNALRIAERKSAQRRGDVYMYRLDWPTPVMGGKLGSVHGLEIPLVFRNIRAAQKLVGNGSDPQIISEYMSQAWINFATSGNPSQDDLIWPTYNTEKRQTMIFDLKPYVIMDPDGDVRRLLQA